LVKESNDKSRATEGSELKTRVDLLNTCMTYGNKFKPVNSMISETLCNLCLREK